MIDYLTFNSELLGIYEMLEHSKDPKVKEARLAIIATMQKYEKRVSDSESENAPKEEVDILKMSPKKDYSFMEHYQNANMEKYDDTQEYDYNSEGDIVRV